MKQKVILLNSKDNVATCLEALPKGELVGVTQDDLEYQIQLREDIAFGHKFALRDIQEGEEVLKYGLPIGKALCDIKTGDWVHVHNCRSERFGFRHEIYGINA